MTMAMAVAVAVEVTNVLLNINEYSDLAKYSL